MTRFLFSIVLFVLSYQVKSQCITSVHTKWDDSFREWILYCEELDIEGDLYMRWQMNNDWSKWNYRMGELSGTIDVKWEDNPEEWQLQGNGNLVYARTQWPRDMSQWRIRDGDIDLIFMSRYTNRMDEWYLKTNGYGEFFMYTDYEMDPRDWIIVDELNPEISFEAKVMMVFLAIFQGSPKI